MSIFIAGLGGNILFRWLKRTEVEWHRWMRWQYAVPAVEPPDDFDSEIETALAEQDRPDELH